MEPPPLPSAPPSPPRLVDDAPSRYEQQRDQNVLRNNAYLVELGLLPAKRREAPVRLVAPKAPPVRFLQYYGLMEVRTFERLRAKFLSMLPFCAWRHLAETPTSLPVLCCDDVAERDGSVLQLYAHDGESVRRVEFEEYGDAAIGAMQLAGFAFVAGLPHSRDGTLAFTADSTKRMTKIVYSGALTAGLHARILLDVLCQFANVTKAWLHYDKFLFEALAAAPREASDAEAERARASLVEGMRFVCLGQQQLGIVLHLETTVGQEVENLRAMHRQLGKTVEMPLPVDTTGQGLGADEGDELRRAREAFEAPQFVRPIVKRNDEDQLSVYYVNLHPIDPALPDVRIASPSARCAGWEAAEQRVAAEAMRAVVYTPTASGLFDGDVILAQIGRQTRGRAEPSPPAVVWSAFQDANPCRISPSPHAEGRTIRYVSPGVLAQKVVGAYAGRFADMPLVETGRSCHEQATDRRGAARFEGSPFTLRDNVEDLMWKERVGRIEGRPPPAGERAAPYVVGVPNTFHFYRVLGKVVDGEVMYLLPFHNYLMLKDYMGARVPLHGRPEAGEHNVGGYKIIKFRRRDDERLWDKLYRALKAPDDAGLDPNDADVRVRTNARIFNAKFARDRGEWEAWKTEVVDGAGRSFFSEAPDEAGFDERGYESGPYLCDKHIRRLFATQVRRTLEAHDLSPGAVAAFMSKFDVDACFPAVDKYDRTTFGYISCSPWPFDPTLDPDKETAIMDFDDDRPAFTDRTVWEDMPRRPLLTNLSKADQARFERLIQTYERVETDPLALRVHGGALFVAFSPVHTRTKTGQQISRVAVSDVGFNTEDGLFDSGIITRASQEDGSFVYPLGYYANGSLFFNDVSNLTAYRQNPCESTLLEAMPNLRLVRGLYAKGVLRCDDLYLTWKRVQRKDAGPANALVRSRALSAALERGLELAPRTWQEAGVSRPIDADTHVVAGGKYYKPELSFDRAMCKLLDAMEREAFAFNIATQGDGSTLFALEVYDTMASLRSVMLVTDLARSIANGRMGNVSINALEMIAVFDEDDGEEKEFGVDDALRRMGCEVCVERQNWLALKRVVERMCARASSPCLVKSGIVVPDGVKFWGPVYFVDPRARPPAEHPHGSVVVGRDQTDGRSQVLRLRANSNDTSTYHVEQGLEIYNGDTSDPQRRAHSEIPSLSRERAQYSIFAVPPPFAPGEHRSALVVRPDAAAIGVGTYQIEGAVLRDGVCDLLFRSGEVITVERAPSFASLRETSIDVATAPGLDAAVVDHGLPVTRCAAESGNVRTDTLVSRVSPRRPACRVRFEHVEEVLRYLQESPTHLVLLGRHGERRTSTVELTASRSPSDEACLRAVSHGAAASGVFPARTALDRRILFVASSDDDERVEEVLDVVLLHVAAGGVVNEADRLRAVARHPGSHVCAEGPTLVYRPDGGPRGRHSDAIAGLVYYNCVVGDAWVLTAALDGPHTLEATATRRSVDGRCWDGRSTVAWNARMIQLHDDGSVTWNAGFTPYLLEAPVASDAEVQYHGQTDAFVLMTPPAPPGDDLQRFRRDASGSTQTHARAALDTPFPLHPATEKISLLVTPDFNATLFVYVLTRSADRSDVTLTHDVRAALEASAIGVGTFDVVVSTTRLAPTTAAPGDVERVAATIKPVVHDRASRRVLAPGQGSRCLVEARFGAYVESYETVSAFRDACVEAITRLFGTGSAASFLLNSHKGYAVTLLNRRSDDAARRGVLASSDVGREVRILDGVLSVDDVERPASWGDAPPDVRRGMIEKVCDETDGTVVIRAGQNHAVVVPNPSPVYRARPSTLDSMYAAAMRVALEHYRP